MDSHYRAFAASMLAVIFTILPAVGAEVADKPMVWAHYVPWNAPKDVSLTTQKYINYPLLRNPGNTEEAYQKEQLSATAQGIDGFFVDLIAKNNDIAYLDRLESMLKAAEKTNFQIGYCVDGKVPAEKHAEYMVKVLSQIANHPNYPKYHGKPVVATYLWYEYSPQEWQQIRDRAKAAGFDVFLIANLRGSSYRAKDRQKMQSYAKVFDMVYDFTVNGIDGDTVAEAMAKNAEVCQNNGKPVMGSMSPGYCGGWRNGRNDFYQSHLEFDRLHECFLALVPGREKWLHFTTWNDHDETSIMPMLFADGNPEIVRAYSDRFKKLDPTQKTPRICAAYHREVYPGTLLRLELMSLPSTGRESSSEVSGYLAGNDGKNMFDLPRRTLKNNDFDRVEYAIPTGKLAQTPVLYPVITVKTGDRSEIVTLPAILLRSGSLLNQTTVKTCLQHLIPMEFKPEIVYSGDVLSAKLDFVAPEKVKYATLFRNDLPLAEFSAAEPTAPLLHLWVDINGGSPDYQIALPDGGHIVKALRLTSAAGEKGFDVSDQQVKASKNLPFMPGGITLSVQPKDLVSLSVDRLPPVTITAGELLQRQLVNMGKVNFMVVPENPAAQNMPPIDLDKGSLKLSLLSRPPRPDDGFFVRYEFEPGKVGWSPIVFPFEDGKQITKNILNTAITLETNLEIPIQSRPREYLDDNLAAASPAGITAEEIHPATVRGNCWTFEAGGNDSLGELPIRQGTYNRSLLPSMPAEKQGFDGNTALRFDGKSSLRMPLRSFPAGAFTLDFYLNPALGSDQTVVFHSGFAAAVDIDLSAAGIIRVTRSGKTDQGMISEQLTSKTPVRKDVWARVRITFDEKELRLYLDGKLDAQISTPPLRAYGNNTWYLGGGNPKQSGFSGLLDNVTLLGQAFSPQEYK